MRRAERAVARAAVTIALLSIASCGGGEIAEESGAASTGFGAPRASAVASVAPVSELAPPVRAGAVSAEGDGACGPRIPVWSAGAPTDEPACARDLERRGLTAIALGDDFAPSIFDEAPELGRAGAQPYRAIYVALADEREDALPDDVEFERDLELFGVFPTFRVLAARLSDDARHACHEAVDDAALASLRGTLRAWTTPVDAQRTRVQRVRWAEATLERERARRGAESIEALAETTRYPGTHRIWSRERPLVEGIRAMQAHLACEGLLERSEDGVFDGRTASALARYQRRHVIVGSGQLDLATRERMRADSRESDFLAVLRALRERVVDASHAIEDGSARGEWGTILGRHVDPPEMRTLVGHRPIADGAPDWISPATEAAAIALGWTSPEAFVDATRARPSGDVAIALPPRPAYHAAHMELRAEIDRGDVWYQYPYAPDGAHRRQPVARRPILTLYARDGEREIALVRWPTTIGGWKPERLPDGTVGLRYKESPVGPRIWRDVVTSPVWLPPPSTPDDEMVRRSWRHGWVPNTELFGPGYRSAYGLVMMMHTREVRRRDGTTFDFDEGVRAHGSVSYGSILRGTSHGCHRLYNHLAVRLGAFLLAHRTHVRHGPIDVRYARDVIAGEGAGARTVPVRIDQRGVRFELTPPVPVEVREGRIRGWPHEAPRGLRPLRGALLEAAQADAASDEGM